MDQKEDYPELFLRLFIKELILNKINNQNIGEISQLDKIKKNIKIYKSNVDSDSQNQISKDSLEGFSKSISESEIRRAGDNFIPIPLSKLNPVAGPIKQIMKPAMRKPSQPAMQRVRIPNQVFKPMQPKQPIDKKINKLVDELVPSISQQKVELGHPKIDSILVDPNVQTVECPGPNKQILVYKGGNIQTANFTLSEEEIKNFMKDLSDKTRIPLTSGVFKAALGNLIITAVMSEFVGTRFILQKKQQPTPPKQTGLYR